ncbi:MAG: ABC transporter ATP-binding protein [Candidatus Gracilibacteria bacterium]|nr:ABC transporter ATP-binding protein [Candidatus Gracilibacteria bacterium]
MKYIETLKKSLQEFKKYIGNFNYYGVIIIGIITVLISSSEPFFTSKAISYVENYVKNNNLNENEIFIFFSIWIIFIISNSIIKYIYRFTFIERNTIRFYIYQSKKYKENIIHMSENVYLNKKSGTLYKILDRGLEGTFVMILTLYGDIFLSFISVIYVTIVLIIINLKMAIATMLVIPFLVIIGYYFNAKTGMLQEEVNKKWNSFYGKIGDYLTNLTLVKTLTFESNISKELDDIQKESLNLQTPLSKRWSIANGYVGFMINVARFIVLGTGIFLIKNQEINFATLFLYFAYINYLYFPIGFIFDHLRNLQKNLEGIKNMYEEFDNLEQDSEFPESKEVKKINGKIEFKNVGFSYIENKKVIKNLTLSINPGEKVALVGSTGSGKSTITKLLLRLFETNKGEILIDGINIKNITKKSLRKHIGIVMQDNTLFNTTILENLKFAKPDATIEEINKAIKSAKADFIFDTKKGLKSIIGERGLKLSGGEKQRISIARIFLKNPEILILDEATSALDNKTEKQIQESLETLMKGKTSIIIAHRLSTIKKSDKIVLIENGEIIEQGTYEELMKLQGKFYELSNPDKLILS